MAIDYLENWAVLNDHIMDLDEETIKELLEKEKNGRARTSILTRLHARYNVLRADRERRELM